MADPLPPIPPLPNVPPPPADAPWHDQLAYWTAATRHADSVANTAALTEQARQAGQGVVSLTAATELQAAIVEPSDADRWWGCLMDQVRADPTGLWRDKVGLGWMAAKADEAMAQFRQRFPPA